MAWYNFRKEKRNQQIHTINDDLEASKFLSSLGLTNKADEISDINNFASISLSAVFAAIELIANSIAELPINVKTTAENKTSIMSGHPLYHLFDKCLLTKYMMIKMLVTDMLLYGDGVAYIERATDGTPLNLIYCPHGTYSIQYNQMSHDLYYIIPSVTSGRVEPINVVHILKNSLDGVTGRGVLFYAGETVELSKYTENAAKKYFKSGMHVSGILSTDARIQDETKRDAIRQAWVDSQKKNGSGLAVLEYGMKYSPVSANSKEAQLLESRLFNLQEIARFFNINPVLLGDLSHSSYSTIEASLLEFVTHTLYPYITLIENELRRKLLKPSEHGLYIDLDAGFILKSDKNSQANYLKTLVSSGIMTINEARQQLGLNPMEEGDKLIIPFTDINQNTVGEQNDNDNDNTNNDSDSPTTDIDS